MNRGSANEILKELVCLTRADLRASAAVDVSCWASPNYDFRPPTIIIGRFWHSIRYSVLASISAPLTLKTGCQETSILHQENTDRNWKTIMRERDVTDAKLRSYLPQ
ncbi:hypothetical protein DTO282F9_6361 [Paecilomyces variotii]|nr:hypothetical protein DTO282F9_6361 [Paecilomyces variotii]